MKKIFTYSLSLWLSICVLFATVGVPVFAHYCTMSSNCKEISVLPVKSCCSEEMASEISDDGCIEATSCCTDELTFFQSELNAIKIFSAKQSITPAIFTTILLFGPEAFFDEGIYGKHIAQQSPPLASGRNLLTQIQVFRI